VQRREYIAVLKGHTKAWDKEMLLKYAARNYFCKSWKQLGFTL